MPFPFIAAAAAAAALGSSVSGALSKKAKNKQAAEDRARQLAYEKQLTGMANDTTSFGNQVAAEPGGYVDPYGGSLVYDPETQQWKLTTSEVDNNIQGASDAEEMSRLTLDQALRRRGMAGAEQLRAGAEGEAVATRNDLANFRAGVGAADPEAITASLRLNRTGAVNAGYDEAQRAANTLSLRQGGAGAGDAASIIARNRAADIARTMGDPELEGMQAAEQINSSRFGNKLNAFNLFNQSGSNVQDSSFAPSTRFSQGLDRIVQQQQLGNQRKSLALDAFATGGQLVGTAASGGRAANQIREQATDRSVWGPVLGDISKRLGAAVPAGGS